MYIYTFWIHDTHCDRAIKYLNFEPNVDVHFSLTSSHHSCGRLLRMTPKQLIKLVWGCSYWLQIVYYLNACYSHPF